MTAAATWLMCPVPHRRPRHRLVCFPHAGGSAGFFRDWGTQLDGIEVHGVCYPGRAHRIEDPPRADLTQLAGEIADAVEPLADRPLALFGHSMGAVVAFEAARVLEARGVALSQLFASGSREGPGATAAPVAGTGGGSAEASAEQEPQAVVQRLLEMGGTDPELAADPELQELVLPYVMSDSQMFHAYTTQPGPPLTVPVTTIVGDVDADADIRPWRELTAGDFRQVVVRGGHFYLQADPPFGLLRETLAGTTNPAGGLR
jgi:surfactin synthase thioesterase subunit